MTDLTKRQREILDFIRKTRDERGYPPSVREIGEAVGLHSPSSVHAQLATLSERGYLSKDPSKPRAITVRRESSGIPVEQHEVRNVPVLGTIAAGGPLLAQEAIEDTLALPKQLVGSGTLFALRVRGDSMINAGIFEGDLVIVRQQSTADDGEIVAALVGDEEATVKRLGRKGGRIVLKPENDAYDPIVSDEVKILGKVVSVMRRV